MPTDEVLTRTLQSHPGIKRFARALARDLPNKLSRAEQVARATRALAGGPTPKAKG